MSEQRESFAKEMEEESSGRMKWLVVLAILSVIGLVAWMMLSSTENLD